MASLLTASKVTKRFGGLRLSARWICDLARIPLSASSVRTAQANQTSTALPASAKPTKARSHLKERKSCLPGQIARWGISRTYQNIRLFAAMTALENILVGQHEFLHSSWLRRNP